LNELVHPTVSGGGKPYSFTLDKIINIQNDISQSVEFGGAAAFAVASLFAVSKVTLSFLVLFDRLE
jgi:hypothetical protein